MFNIYAAELHVGGSMAEIPIAPGSGDGKLYRSRNNRMLFGVCGGIGKYFNTDPTIIRIIWVLFSLIYLVGVLAYIIAVLVIPEEPQ
jgi:phage shock protein PspC (stress-responsive transcriptional regulator)